MRLGEKILCRYFPGFARKLDISIGLAQLKISTVKHITGEPVKAFIMKLFDEKYNIEICAQYLAELVKEYQSGNVRDDENHYSSVYADNIYEFIANQYIAGSAISFQRFSKVYAAILQGSVPELNSCNG